MADSPRPEAQTLSPKRKVQLVRMLLEHNSLQFGDFKTRRGWQSPYFINTGAFASGATLIKLTSFYASAIDEHFGGVSCIYGPAYKGIPLCVAISMVLQNQFNKGTHYSFNRKEAKRHGEATSLSSSNPRSLFVGHVPTADDKILVVDDVVSSGKSLQKAIDDLRQLNIPIEGVLVLVDREEPIDQGSLLAKDFFEQQKISFYSLVTASGILRIVKEHFAHKINAETIERFESYIGARKGTARN